MSEKKWWRFWTKEANPRVVTIRKVRANGVIVYNVESMLNSAPAKRHLKDLEAHPTEIPAHASV